MTSISPRKTAPVNKSQWSDPQSFRVWSHSPSFMEDTTPWHCVAMFRFLGDCLAYIADLQDNGVDCVFQSPADTKPVSHTERRVVYKPTAELQTA